MYVKECKKFLWQNLICHLIETNFSQFLSITGFYFYSKTPKKVAQKIGHSLKGLKFIDLFPKKCVGFVTINFFFVIKIKIMSNGKLEHENGYT